MERRDSVTVRARDQVVLEALFPSLQPRLSTPTGTFFWKGQLPLIDGSAQSTCGWRKSKTMAGYSTIQWSRRPPSKWQELCGTPFPSAARALRALELQMNRQIYESAMTR